VDFLAARRTSRGFVTGRKRRRCIPMKIKVRKNSNYLGTLLG